jgi:hypothetical protein
MAATTPTTVMMPARINILLSFHLRDLRDLLVEEIDCLIIFQVKQIFVGFDEFNELEEAHIRAGFPESPESI